MGLEVSNQLARRIASLEAKLTQGNQRLEAYQNELKRPLSLDVVSKINSCIFYTIEAQKARREELTFLKACKKSF